MTSKFPEEFAPKYYLNTILSYIMYVKQLLNS